VDSLRDFVLDGLNWLVLIAFIVLLVVGWSMLFKKGAGDGHTHEAWRALGSSLITGACVSLAIFLLQGFADVRSKEEDFRQRIAFSGNLSGFDPGGRNLNGMNLAGKTLNDARFNDARLAGATLQDSVLIGAHLEGANLRDAVLIAANLSNAALGDADLRGADLREAQLDGAQLFAKGDSGVTPANWKGVKVNYHTCWPRGFNYDDPQLGLVPMRTRKNPQPSRGRYCNELKPSERLSAVPGTRPAG
jgi:Pentapeptide repeats (8 copies)